MQKALSPDLKTRMKRTMTDHLHSIEESAMIPTSWASQPNGNALRQNLLIVDRLERWKLEIPDAELITAREYVTDPQFLSMRGCKVFNLCRSYGYQSIGYYVSLLAEARGHKPLPTVSTIQDLKNQSIIRVVSGELDELIQKSLAHLQSHEFELSIYFARNIAKHYDRLSRNLFNLFPAPLLNAKFKRSLERWRIQSIGAISAAEIPEHHHGYVQDIASDYFINRNSHRPRRSAPRFHLAILVDPKETFPPSDEKALEKFRRAAVRREIATELIEKDDYGRLGEFDGLFIRVTTAVNSYVYRFARRAEAEGLVVIDDPISIVRCTNKVYLAELLTRNRIPIPQTRILHRDNLDDVLKELGLPCILKEPDSSFSQGVAKATTAEEFFHKAKDLLEKSEMLIAQEFVHTDFDWRIGVIDQRPLYACKYYMARGHWQIYNHEKDSAEGKAETLPVELVPKRVLNAALRAANLMGDGLYGVDVKENGKAPFVIEVNDNPSIDHGVEDKLLRDDLYGRIMDVFLKRMTLKKEGRHS